MRDRIEFYLDRKPLGVVESSHAPDSGDLVNIRKTTYRVIGRSYTFDHMDEPRETSAVCVLALERTDEVASLS